MMTLTPRIGLEYTIRGLFLAFLKLLSEGDDNFGVHCV